MESITNVPPAFKSSYCFLFLDNVGKTKCSPTWKEISRRCWSREPNRKISSDSSSNNYVNFIYMSKAHQSDIQCTNSISSMTVVHLT